MRSYHSGEEERICFANSPRGFTQMGTYRGATINANPRQSTSPAKTNELGGTVPLVLRLSILMMGMSRPVGHGCPLHHSVLRDTNDLLNDVEMFENEDERNDEWNEHSSEIAASGRRDGDPGRFGKPPPHVAVLMDMTMPDCNVSEVKCSCRTKVRHLCACLVPAIIALGHLLDVGYNQHFMWGQDHYMLAMLSYDCFIIQLILVSLYSFATRFVLLVTKPSRKASPVFNVLENESVHSRVLLLTRDAKSRKCVQGMMTWLECFFLPIVCAVLRSLTTLVLFPPMCYGWFFYASDALAVTGFLLYGSFWSIVYVYRVSFQRQSSLIARLLTRLSTSDDHNRGRRHIRSFYAKFYVVREVMGYWMAVTSLTVSWHVMTRLMWDYINEQRDMHTTYFSVMVWLQSVTFAVTPLIALGGMNLDYVWKSFYHEVVSSSEDSHKGYWMAMTRYVREIDNLGRAEIKWTFVFTFIGLFLSLWRLNDMASLEYWTLRYTCNSTNHNDTV